MPYPPGRALGGSGLINAMAYIRGHRAATIRERFAAVLGQSYQTEPLLKQVFDSIMNIAA